MPTGHISAPEIVGQEPERPRPKVALFWGMRAVTVSGPPPAEEPHSRQARREFLANSGENWIRVEP